MSVRPIKNNNASFEKPKINKDFETLNITRFYCNISV